MKTPKKKKSALKEKEGVKSVDSTDDAVIRSIQSKRRSMPATEDLINGIVAADISALSRAITLVESTSLDHYDQANEIIKACLPLAKDSIRIGITGVPGVGKSTFIERFGKQLTDQGFRVAVLAVDPSSSISRGSILGDKTRMEDLVRDPNAYIRPSASGETLGGVARKTRETIILCEAAGFDVILIETVGVGQSETAVHSMVDFFLLLKLAGAGDELQGIKRGIIEMADAIVINKADGDNIKPAKRAKVEFERALHLYPLKASKWQPKVLTCSAVTGDGIDDIWKLIDSYKATMTQSGFFAEKRHDQNKYWLIQTIEERIKADFFSRPEIKRALREQLIKLENNETSPFAAAAYLLSL
ncbi:MAG: methylmalonyl Co-A mutase-associated GTPase MeaB [Flavobacteriaceae bacterium]|nr:methylmalonyl Co-A mutase-associated GTPase MeaB [Bacteroidia bacterium]NNF75033.1 methylmalonyl Co-A mutase-associated GTPase MeaB [Flavobacteriaceae bacterium]